MNLTSLLTGVTDLLGGSPILLMFAVIGLGYLVGSLRIFGFSLGPSAVLFTGILIGSLDPRLRIPDVIYVLGLVLFVYTIGLQAGPTFFSSFGPRAFRANIFAFGIVAIAALVAIAAARVFGLNGPTLVGVFCGALTNTPALAASIETLRHAVGPASTTSAEFQTTLSAPVIGFGISYPFGVIGVLLGFHLFGRMKARRGEKITGESGDAMAAGPILSRTFRVTNPGIVGKPVSEILGDGNTHGFVLSRMRRGGESSLVYAGTTLEAGDLVVAVGDHVALERALMILGEESRADIQAGNREFDLRRIEVSDKRVVGKRIAELNIQELLDATITRIRRGDVDFVPTGDTILERGDRLRVLTWTGNMDRVARFIGDSVRSSSEADFLSLSIGLVFGVLAGLIPFPLPGGGTFSLGFAGGPLIVGLLLGRARRSGPITWGMPFSVNLTLRQTGLVLFLAGIGTKAGEGFVRTLNNGGWMLMGVGASMTIVATLLTLVLGSRLLRLSYPSVMGLMSGIQTQPACLSYANEHGGSDAPNIWYAAVYPVSMIAKIILAQLLVVWLL